MKTPVSGDRCTGCGLCSAVCPVDAISMETAPDGFRYPVIDNSKCVSCQKCVVNCPERKKIETGDIRRFCICQNQNASELKRSSSGGFSYVLAKQLLHSGGYVAGCIFDENLHARHVITNDIEVVKKMQGSKYVQSDLDKEIFREIEAKLNQNIRVLFIGTPCQVAAMRRYCKDHEKLIAVDLICHGVGSPGVLRRYLKIKEKKLKGKIDQIYFRSKERRIYPDTYHMTLASGSKTYDRAEMKDAYYTGFSSGRFLRESCFRCSYANKCRTGLLSLGDYLAESGIPDSIKRSKGISLVCVNTDRGEELLKELKGKIEPCELAKEPVKKNLKRPERRPKERSRLNRYDVRDDSVKVNGLFRRTCSDVVKNLLPKDLKKKIKSITKKPL